MRSVFNKVVSQNHTLRNHSNERLNLTGEHLQPKISADRGSSFNNTDANTEQLVLGYKNIHLTDAKLEVNTEQVNQ